MTPLNLLIVGYGNIGRHVYNDLHPLIRQGFNLDIYDKFVTDNNTIKDITYDMAFICVPTDNNEEGKVQIDAVEDAVASTKANIIVIKSTIPVGASEYFKEKYSKRIVFSPEYYGTTIHAPASPNFVVLAGDRQDTEVLCNMYSKIKDGTFRIKFTDYRTAELAKYMENCFLGLKVTFCCEFAEIAKDFGISYPELREIFIMDQRMGDSHTYVDPEQPYYDSHCLNKDIPALVNQSDKAELMKACMNINLSKKHPDCNQCGDYEYCAFDYDNCTGFIPN